MARIQIISLTMEVSNSLNVNDRRQVDLFSFILIDSIIS